MFRKSVSFLLPVALSGVAVVILISQLSKRNNPVPVTRMAPPQSPGAARRLPPPEVQSAKADLGKTGSGCDALWQTLSELNLSETFESTAGGGADPDASFAPMRTLARRISESPCTTLNPSHPLFARQQAFLAACPMELLELRQEEVAPETFRKFHESSKELGKCQLEIQKYRLKIVKLKFQDVPLSEINNVQTLISMAANDVMDQNVDLQRLADIGAQILRNDPDNRIGAELLVRAKYLQSRNAANGSELNRELSAATERLRGIAPNGELVAEMRFAELLDKRDLSALKNLADATSLSNPKSDIGPYYGAWASYLNGNLDEAKRTLTSLLKTQPTNARARYSLDKLSGPAPTDNGSPFISDAAVPVPGDLLASLPY